MQKIPPCVGHELESQKEIEKAELILCIIGYEKKVEKNNELDL
jgi:hypothetical protein